MKKSIILLFALSLVSLSSNAQKYLTRTGKVSFYGSTPLEKIEAINNEVACVLDAEKGAFIFQVPVQSFKFEKSLMQEHFNENYMESSTYPKAEYKGTIEDISKVDFSKNGTYEVNTKGKLKVHGVTKEVSIPGEVTVKGKDVTIRSEFKIVPQDYNIEIPGVVADKIAKEIEVTVNSIMQSK